MQLLCIFIFPDGFDECMYIVTKLKEMPKLHRAVWRGDLIKVKSIGNGVRKTVLNTRDKEHRSVLVLTCVYSFTNLIIIELPYILPVPKERRK